MEGGKKGFSGISQRPWLRDVAPEAPPSKLLPSPTPPPTCPGQPLPSRSTLASKVTLRGQHLCRCCRGVAFFSHLRDSTASPVSWTQSPQQALVQDRTLVYSERPMDHCNPALRTRLWRLVVRGGRPVWNSLQETSLSWPWGDWLLRGQTKSDFWGPRWPTSRSQLGSWPPAPLLPQCRRHSTTPGSLWTS